MSDLTPRDHLIEFCLFKKGWLINELLEKGFDSLNALKLVEADDIRSQKIPIGQRKLLLHLAKTLNKGAGTQSDFDSTTVQPVPVETGSVTQQSGDSSTNAALTNDDGVTVTHNPVDVKTVLLLWQLAIATSH